MLHNSITEAEKEDANLIEAAALLLINSETNDKHVRYNIRLGDECSIMLYSQLSVGFEHNPIMTETVVFNNNVPIVSYLFDRDKQVIPTNDDNHTVFELINALTLINNHSSSHEHDPLVKHFLNTLEKMISDEIENNNFNNSGNEDTSLNPNNLSQAITYVLSTIPSEPFMFEENYVTSDKHHIKILYEECAPNSDSLERDLTVLIMDNHRDFISVFNSCKYGTTYIDETSSGERIREPSTDEPEQPERLRKVINALISLHADRLQGFF